MILFTEAPAPDITLINILKEPEIAIVETQIVETPPTWRDNPNNCAEDQYIAAEEPFYCIDIPEVVESTTQAQKPVRTAQIKSSGVLARAGSGWYPVGQCTHYVWTKRAVGLWNNASEWYWQAQRDGWATGTTPQAGAIGVQKTGNHVVYIESVDGDRVYISERNYDFNGSYREKWEDANKYLYIY